MTITEAPAFEFRCTHDLLFKALFTYKPQSGQHLARSLIEAIFNQKFSQVDLAPTDLIQEGLDTKDIRMDLCAHLDPRRCVNIEMQTAASRMDIRNRSVYYASSLLTQQKNKGLSYTRLTPVNQIFLVDFRFNDSAEAVHEFVYRNPEEVLTEVSKIHIIELDKITQMNHHYSEMSLLEKWCWFLKKYEEQSEDPVLKAMMEKEEIFKEAKAIMETMSKDQRLRDAAFARNRRLMDQAQLVYEGEMRGREEGLEKGIEKGLEKGKKLGIDEGRTAERLENARRMLQNHIDDQLILECTGIDDHQLASLKQELSDMKAI